MPEKTVQRTIDRFERDPQSSTNIEARKLMREEAIKQLQAGNIGQAVKTMDLLQTLIEADLEVMRKHQEDNARHRQGLISRPRISGEM